MRLNCWPDRKLEYPPNFKNVSFHFTRQGQSPCGIIVAEKTIFLVVTDECPKNRRHITKN